MSLKIKIILFFVTLNILLIALLGDLWLMFKNEHRLSDLQMRRYESRLLAEELRRSSDDLTRMARTYVITGDKRFHKYFQDISAIRNGLIPKPGNYENIFWDFVCADKEYIYTLKDKISIVDAMKRLHFTDIEINTLKDAKKLSDNLINMEVRAFNILNGFYLDMDGKYTVKGPPNPELARKILFSDEYHKAKARIMAKINIFFHLINSRTETNVQKVFRLQFFYMLIAMILSLIMVAMGTVGYYLFHRDLTIPLGRLSRWIKMMQKGQYNFDAKNYKKDEIGLVTEAFADMANKVSEYITNLELISKTDPLTQIGNRMSLDIAFQKEFYKFTRYKTPCAIIMLDIDHFKRINDNFGHIMGDFILISIAIILKEMTRQSDIPGRWGGEEFIIICPSTDIKGGKALAELIREKIQDHDFGIDQKVTVSLGVSMFEKGFSIEDTVKKADRMLYKAKNEGRNRVG